MKYLPLVLSNLKRHMLRTILTIMSVALALFLFWGPKPMFGRIRRGTSSLEGTD